MRETIPYTMLLRHLDDVYVGLLCQDAGITLEHDVNFTSGMEDITKDKKYPCGLYNLHGFLKIDDFIEIRDRECKTRTRFRVKDWKQMMDPKNSMTKEIIRFESIYGR